jgi:hypothetical protein
VVDPGETTPGDPVKAQILVRGYEVADTSWTVDDEPRQAGSFLEVSFEEPGDHAIDVTVETQAGETLEASQTVTVQASNTSAEDANETGEAQSVPGPGALLAVAATGLAARLARSSLGLGAGELASLEPEGADEGCARRDADQHQDRRR